MKKTVILVSVIGLALAQVASAGIIIDASTNNGGLLSGVTSADNGTTNSAAVQAIDPIVANDAGRAMLSNAGNGDWISIDGWTVTRTSYNGGNAALGWDAGNLVGTEPAQYVFMNASTAVLESDVIAGSFAAGEIFSLSYWDEMTSSTVGGTTTATLLFSTGETHTFGGHSVSGTAAQFADNYTLASAATSVQVSILMTTATSGAPQLKLDSVELSSVIPEPATLGLVAVFGGAALFIRRRFMI